MATEAADIDLNHSYKDSKDSVPCSTDSPRHRIHALLSSKRGSFRNLLPQPPQRLLTFEEAPKWMQQNSCIRSGYRPELGSFRACLKSLTFPHNELRTSSLTLWAFRPWVAGELRGLIRAKVTSHSQLLDAPRPVRLVPRRSTPRSDLPL